MARASLYMNGRFILWALAALVPASNMGCDGNPSSADSDEGSPGQASDDVTQMLQSELAAAPAAITTSSVKPSLKCVDRLSSSSYRAHFGYNNTSSHSISIPVGYYNRFYPSPIGRGQPTSFAAGSYSDVMQVTFSSNSTIAWVLGSGVQAATRNAKLCSSGGSGGAGTGGAATGGATGTGGKVGTGGVTGTGGTAGAGGTAGRGGSGGAGGSTGGAGTGGIAGAGGTAGGNGGMPGTGGASCPSTCDDHNPCTVDFCNSSTSFLCSNVSVADGTACNDGNACTLGDSCVSGVCTAGVARLCVPADQCHTAGVCNPTNGACSAPVVADGTVCSDGSACTSGDSCLSGTCMPGTPTVCTASDQCHVAGSCDPTSGLCSNPAAPNGTTCNDANACTTIDTCQAGSCTGGSPRICPAVDQCHVPGTCAPSTGICSNPQALDGTSCSDGNACTVTDVCLAGTCTSGPPKACTALDQCHAAGICDSTTGICSNPAVADGTTCDDANMCSLGDACLTGVCTPTVTLTPTHCSGTACDTCSFDPDVGNCVPATDGCDLIADPTDKSLCESAYACFTNPANHCVAKGDPISCWCGSNYATCFTDNSGPTMANGPCLPQVFAAAKSTDAATIRLRMSDPDYPVGRAVNLTICRGGFCSVECGVP